MRTIDQITADLQREQARLIALPLRGPGTLEQSQVVDRLLVELMRAQALKAVS